jgi:hypothetical protein
VVAVKLVAESVLKCSQALLLSLLLVVMVLSEAGDGSGELVSVRLSGGSELRAEPRFKLD